MLSVEQKLEGLPRIVYINLDEATERNEHMVSMFKKFGVTNYSRFGTQRPNKSKHPTLTASEYGCLMSHINIIMDFAKTDEEYLLIMEDDVELYPVEQWDFTWQDLMSQVGKFDIFQVIRIKRDPINIDLTCKKWEKNDSTTAAYIITNSYAKQVTSRYRRKGLAGFKNFRRSVGPVADYALYVNVDSISANIFWLSKAPSQIGVEAFPESVAKNHDVMKEILSKPITLKDIFK